MTNLLINDGDILMRNNFPCKTNGVNLIKILMHDDTVRYFLIRFIPYFLFHIMIRMQLMLVNIFGVSNRYTKL